MYLPEQHGRIDIATSRFRNKLANNCESQKGLTCVLTVNVVGCSHEHSFREVYKYAQYGKQVRSLCFNMHGSSMFFSSILSEDFRQHAIIDPSRSFPVAEIVMKRLVNVLHVCSNEPFKQQVCNQIHDAIHI